MKLPRVNVKVERDSTFTLRVTFHTLPPSPPWLPLFYLRAFIRKNYATVEIHLKTCYVNIRVWWFSRARVVSSTIPNWLSLRGRRSKGKGKGIRARRPRAREEEGRKLPFSLARPNSPFLLLTPATQAITDSSLTCFPCARYEDDWRKVSIPTKWNEGTHVVEPWLSLAREQAIQLRENGQASGNAPPSPPSLARLLSRSTLGWLFTKK